MKKIHVKAIEQAVSEACIRINRFISDDVLNAFQKSVQIETSAIGKSILEDLIKNSEVAAEKEMPICQDTGMVVAFITLGQDVRIEGGGLSEAVQSGVRRGYEEGFLRKSVVADPIERVNTKDNTPAVIYYEVVEGDCFKIDLAAKGFGSENMSRSIMLKPSDGIEGVEAFVIETVKLAGSNPCPPIVVGVGIGGTIDKAAQLAKKALFRPIGHHSEVPYVEALEKTLLEKINALDIGPQGFGGLTTALGVNVLTFPTHIAGLPVVVNINCHASRHEEIVF